MHVIALHPLAIAVNANATWSLINLSESCFTPFLTLLQRFARWSHEDVSGSTSWMEQSVSIQGLKTINIIYGALVDH